MPDKKTVEIATLGLIRALPDMMVGNEKDPYIRGLYKRLINKVDRRLAIYPKLNKKQFKRAKKIIDLFGEETGWHDGRGRHVCTHISFLIAACCEVIPHDRTISDQLVEIWDYFKEIKKLPAPCGWAGWAAYLKFERIAKSCYKTARL